MRDVQVGRFYSMERALRGGDGDCAEELTLGECAALVAKACRRYGVRPPRVDGAGCRTRGRYYRRDHVIALPPRARNVPYVLHEAAHAITPWLGHSPAFACVWLDLMARYAGARKADLRAAARRHRVRIAPAAAAPRPLLRRRPSAAARQAAAAASAALSAAAGRMLKAGG